MNVLSRISNMDMFQAFCFIYQISLISMFSYWVPIYDQWKKRSRTKWFLKQQLDKLIDTVLCIGVMQVMSDTNTIFVNTLNLHKSTETLNTERYEVWW